MCFLSFRHRKWNHDNIGKKFIRVYLLVLFCVSSFSYKLAVCYNSSLEMIWFPFILWQDVLVAYIIFRLSSLPFLILTALVTSVLTSVELIAICIKNVTVPWKILWRAFADWQMFKGLIMDELKEPAELSIGQIWVSLLIISFFLTVLVKRICKIRTQYHFCKRTVKGKIGGIVLFYMFLAYIFQRRKSNSHLSRNILLNAGWEIYLGYQEYRSVNSEINSSLEQVSSIWRAAIGQGKPNVVVVLLETMRKDMMPFDYSSPFAKTFLKDDSPPVTPFYDQWTKDSATVLFPRVQSTSAHSLKSQFSIFCSQYPLPLNMNQEHNKKFLHQCLPHILSNQGYATKLFNGMTRNFDHQISITKRMGFHGLYGKEDLIDEQPEDQREAFAEKYHSGWESLEDIPFLEPMMKWVDEQHSQQIPFLMVYETSVTHFPHPIPRNNWTRKEFSDHRLTGGGDHNNNKWLNTVAYTDQFLKLFVEEFDKRGLTDNTLIVMLGDHGADLWQYGKGTPFEVVEQVCYEVSTSFHTRNSKIHQLLEQARPHINGNWTTLDVTPTILELLDIPFTSFLEEEMAMNNNTSYSMDGKSMLQPSGSRLILSIVNPGEGLVLKDGNLILTEVKQKYLFYDLQADPLQKYPRVVENTDRLATLNENDSRYEYYQQWIEKAAPFMQAVRKGLEEEFESGIRNANGAVAKLLTLKSLI